MGTLFGTDGVRGLANADLTPELALALGRAAVGVLRAQAEAGPGPTGPGSRPAVVVGRDPRASGVLLENALVAGILSAGGDVLAAGVVPTPAVAFLTRHYGAAAGAVISASHNAMPDNGIKFFGPEGFKLPDAVEVRIEAAVAAPDHGAPRPVGAEVGGLRPTADDAVEAYLAHLLEGIPDLDGLEVVVDCANGAAAECAPEAYRRAGAKVTAVAAEPDGHNINAGVGSTHPEHVKAALARTGAAVGLAHDGDADRLLAVDEHGNLVDGDVILAICALDARDRGDLPTNTVVTTVMTNLGFKKAMAEHGIAVVQTAVGDRYVLEAMLAGGHHVGGEQSGHLIFLDRATTGDGLLTGLRLLGVVARSGKPLSELARVIHRLPQVLVNVAVADRDALDGAAAVWHAVAEEEGRLGDSGRVLVRPSGTEALVRVMVEAETEEAARTTADRLAAVVTAELG
ncbi:MAG TPA: phosphoglucosamine mutase [Actinomycetes bacterium]|nr:phosphoglucosamine mutase [Actinomycetes bacterium]